MTSCFLYPQWNQHSRFWRSLVALKTCKEEDRPIFVREGPLDASILSTHPPPPPPLFSPLETPVVFFLSVHPHWQLSSLILPPKLVFDSHCVPLFCFLMIFGGSFWTLLLLRYEWMMLVVIMFSPDFVVWRSFWFTLFAVTLFSGFKSWNAASWRSNCLFVVERYLLPHPLFREREWLG